MEEKNLSENQIINNQVVQKEKINSKKPLGIGAKIFSIILILAQISFILYLAYLQDKDPQFSAEFNGMGYAFLGIFLIALSIISATIFLTYRKKHVISIALLFINIWLPFSHNITQVIKPIFGPSWGEIYNQSPEGQKETANRNKFLNKQTSIAQEISKEFEKPQKVLFTDSQYNVLILENGYVVKLSNNPLDMSDKNQSKFIEWADKNLAGGEADFSLPNYKTGSTISGGVYTCEGDGSYIDKNVIAVRLKYKIPEYKSNFCTIIPAQIMFQGESLYKKFCVPGAGSQC